MKKILIALPLVLVMLLTMIPVAAEETKQAEVSVTINYFEKADDSKAAQSQTLTMKVEEGIANDEAKLKAEAEKFFGTVQSPDGKKYEAKEVKAVKRSQAEGKKIENSVTKTPMTFEEYKGKLEASGFTFDVEDVKDEIAGSYITDALLTKVNKLIPTMMDNTIQVGQKTIKLAKGDVNKDAKQAALTNPVKYITTEPGKVTEASVTIKAVMVEGSTCVKPCEFITIKAFDLSTNAFHPTLQFKYKTVQNQIPEFSAAIEHMMSKIADAHMQVVNNFDLTKQILLPATNDKCEIIINVIPTHILIDVIHELFGCCTNSKGDVYRPGFPEKSFKEEDVWVPFIEFTTQRVINQVKAEEWATTRIQQVTGAEWVFEKATFIDKFNPGRYLTGKVYTIDGKEIGDIANWYEHRRKIDVPTVIIQYRPVNCIAKDEEKVDNATVENNNNTTAPVTANGGANLPATGAKDVSAFFLSAVALLGLGIFFAKKH